MRVTCMHYCLLKRTVPSGGTPSKTYGPSGAVPTSQCSTTTSVDGVGPKAAVKGRHAASIAFGDLPLRADVDVLRYHPGAPWCPFRTNVTSGSEDDILAQHACVRRNRPILATHGCLRQSRAVSE